MAVGRVVRKCRQGVCVRSGWVGVGGGVSAKKLDEAHAEAEAELGMVSNNKIAADLPALPGEGCM